MMILSESLEFYSKEARQFQQELTEIHQPTELTTYYKQCSQRFLAN